MDETGLMVMLDGLSGGGTTDILYITYSPRVQLYHCTMRLKLLRSESTYHSGEV